MAQEHSLCQLDIRKFFFGVFSALNVVKHFTQKLELQNIDLVFLNCCFGGSGILYEEGPVGLTRAFLIAGVRNVVAYTGEVPDSDVTCAFYEEWVNHREADTALRAAQINMLENGVHHNFWAGYKVIRQRVDTYS